MMNFIKTLKERLKGNFKENKVLLIIFAFIWIVAIVVTLNFYKTTLGKESIGKQNCEKVIELNENVTISQSMTSINDANSIAVKFATYARSNSGNIYIRLIGNQSKTIYLQDSISTSKIQDNAFTTFELKSYISKDQDNTVTLELSSDSKEGMGIGVYYGEDKEFGCLDEDTKEERYSLLSINGQTVEDELGFKYLIDNEELMSFSNKLIIFSIIGYSLLVFILLMLQPNLEVLFSMIILVFGLIFMAVIVPLSPPDEQYHYEASLQVSNYILGNSEDHTVVNKRYGDYSYLYGHYNVSGGYIRFLRDINIPLELSKNTYTISQDIDDVYSVCFIPQSIGVTIARLLNVNMLRTFYAGRLTNLIFYIACVYIAIKNTPVNKLLFGILACMPMFIQTASSYSYDCFIISLCFILASFLFKWIFKEEEIHIVDYFLVFVCSLGLAPIKYVYGFLPLLFIFVPKKRFKNKLWIKLIGILILVMPGMSYLMPMILERIIKNIGKLFNLDGMAFEINEHKNIISTDNSFGVAQEEIKFNASYMFTHPKETILIFIRTIRFNIKQWFYNSLGRALSGETLILPSILFQSLALIVTFTAFRKEEYVPCILLKFFSVGICAVIGLTIMVGMFLSWTESNQVIIEDFGGMMVQGVQGRYFSPLLPYFFMIFNNKKLHWPIKWDKYVILCTIIVNFEILIYILSYTFVN